MVAVQCKELIGEFQAYGAFTLKFLLPLNPNPNLYLHEIFHFFEFAFNCGVCEPFALVLEEQGAAETDLFKIFPFIYALDQILFQIVFGQIGVGLLLCNNHCFLNATHLGLQFDVREFSLKFLLYTVLLLMLVVETHKNGRFTDRTKGCSLTTCQDMLRVHFVRLDHIAELAFSRFIHAVIGHVKF